jgi:hypothetical protein
MRDTEKSADWIARMMKNNPCTDIGEGNFRTTICRLSFPNLFGRSKPIPPNTEGKYGANLLFPLDADIKLLRAAASAAAREKWGSNLPPKLKNPFKDSGYTPGAVYVIATADKSRPLVLDPRNQPILDEDRVYPGVWAICVVRPFVYDKGVNKGVSFGLQGVMIVSDDKTLGGGRLDPNAAFGGVSVDDEYNPASAFQKEDFDPLAATKDSGLFD